MVVSLRKIRDKNKSPEKLRQKIRPMREGKRQAGMTLVELLIVIVIIVILVSMVLIATNRSRINAEEQLTRGTITVLDTALQEYYDYTNSFPVLLESGGEFASDYDQHNALLYAQLNLVPDSKKVLGQIADSQIRKIDKGISFIDRWGTLHEQESYLVISDAWGTVLDYLYDPDVMSFPLIISAGPDRSFGTADDIDNKKK